MQNQFELQGEALVDLHDMGDEMLVLCQRNDADELEQIAIEWGQLVAAVEALRQRYGYELKNTEPESLTPAAA